MRTHVTGRRPLFFRSILARSHHGRSIRGKGPALGRRQGVFGLPLKRLRTILRICHLTFGMLLIPYIYSPLGDLAVFEWVVRIALFPLSVVTGIAMWQEAKLRKLLAKGRPA
jgi:hypothetical protein